jgi:hypothetical protein
LFFKTITVLDCLISHCATENVIDLTVCKLIHCHHHHHHHCPLIPLSGVHNMFSFSIIFYHSSSHVHSFYLMSSFTVHPSFLRAISARVLTNPPPSPPLNCGSFVRWVPSLSLNLKGGMKLLAVQSAAHQPVQNCLAPVDFQPYSILYKVHLLWNILQLGLT